MSEFNPFVDLASERLGGLVLAANDDFFAPKENLLKPAAPVFIEDKYTDRGKWMDGWETRRRRTPGHDWCILRLGLPGILRSVLVDTSFFRGNFPEHCSLEACGAPGSPSAEELTAPQTRWHEVLPKSSLEGHAQNRFAVTNPFRFTHLRLNIFPDGGVARLRVFGDVIPDWKSILAAGKEVDLIAVQHGGRIVECSDMFFSAPQNLLMPDRGVNMGDGWETRRRRGPGFDWVVLKLGIAGSIRRIEVDTAHFKGNFPESCSLEACDASAAADSPHEKWSWKPLLPRTTLQADHQHIFQSEILDPPEGGRATHVRFNIYPDGGVSRLRLFGLPSHEGKIAATLTWLNALFEEDAHAALLDCCGSSAWARAVSAARPYASVQQLHDAAGRACSSLSRADWLEAFSRHPKIGESKASGEQSAAHHWSGQEQSSIVTAAPEILASLAEANRAYEQRFGYIFIVCATGKSPDEMLALARRRLTNDPETELRAAAEEQRKITRLRLEKLCTP